MSGALNALRELLDKIAQYGEHEVYRSGVPPRINKGDLDRAMSLLTPDRVGVGRPGEHFGLTSAIEQYQQDPYWINQALRSEKGEIPTTEFFGRQAEALKNAMLANPSPVPFTTYRGVTIGPRSKASGDLFYNPPKKGETLGSEGVVSTSLDPAATHKFMQGPPMLPGSRGILPTMQSYLMKIAVPEGHPFLPLTASGKHRHEAEIALAPGTGFEVTADPHALPGHAADVLPVRAVPPGSYPKPRGYLAGLGALALPGMFDQLYQPKDYGKGGLVEKLLNLSPRSVKHLDLLNDLGRLPAVKFNDNVHIAPEHEQAIEQIMREHAFNPEELDKYFNDGRASFGTYYRDKTFIPHSHELPSEMYPSGDE